MLKSELLLFALNDMDDSDLESARKRLGYKIGGTAGRIAKKRIITFALVAALILGLGTAAYALGWFGLRQRVTPVESVTQSISDPGDSGILSRSAYADEPAGQAHAAWIAYMNEHRKTYTNLSNNDAENWHPDDPELQKLQPIYGAFDEEAIDKLLEIRDEYGVTLHTEVVIPPTKALFLRVTGLEPFMRSENGMDGWPTAYVYEDGSYHAEGGRAKLADGTELDFTVDCGRRGTLDPAYLPVIHVEDYTEQEYTNASGDTVVLSVAEGQGSSFIFYESEDYLVTVRSTSDKAEVLADCFDFAAMVCLHPDLSAVQNTSPSVAEVRDGLMTLADFAQTDEYLASSAFQTLFNDYYLPIANEKLAKMNSFHPEGYSQLYYYGSFPTGIAEVDEGLSNILTEYPLEAPGEANIIWGHLPFHNGGILPGGGMDAEAYEKAEAEGALSDEEIVTVFGMGSFLSDANIDSVIVWENGARYCEFRIGNLGGTLHYIPKGSLDPLFHPILKPDSKGWAYDTACGEQVSISAVTEGDTIYLSGLTPENQLVAAAYDTLSGEWQRIDFTTADAYHPQLGSLSHTGHSLWGLLQEGPSREDINKGRFRDDYGYYVLHIDLISGESSAVRIPFEGEGSTEGSGLHFSGILGLDDSRALLGAMDRFYMIDANVSILSEPDLPTNGGLFHFRVGNTLYLWTQDGYAPFDPEALRFGPALDIDGLGEASSNNGHFLRKWQRSLCSADPESGESELLFRWMDIALSFGDTQGHSCLENSLGDVYYPDGEDWLLNRGLICAKKGQVPVKQPLRLGCFGYTGGEMYADAQANGALPYSATMELLDAIVRFNNTDPQYKIEVVPITYANDQERDRVLIELATRSDLDLLDTSLLPDNALDSGLLADMLPMIDADETISREDFIEPLLKLMTQSGGLFEYTDKFTLLTMTTHADLFPGRDQWTVENIESLIASHPEMDPLWHSYDRELITTLFCWAATAEFIDRDTATCSFDSPAFVHWLELMKALPDGGQYSEEAKLMNICYDLAFNAGHQEKYMMKGEYVVAGFPETQGTGSYFLKLGSSPNDWRGTMGENTRIGILAASGNQAGAWRFVRQLMEGAEGASLIDGIPVFKASFERALTAQISDDFDERFQISYMTAENAEELRQQVYNTTKLVDTDEGMIRILRDEINRYYGGQYSAEETAKTIQSRASIYVSEQYG